MDGKMKMAKMLAVVVALILIAALAIPAAAESGNVRVELDGEMLEFQEEYGQAFIDINNRTQVPLRGMMEAFGATVEWNEATRVATVEKDGTKVEVPIGESYIVKNGKKINNDTISTVKGGRTYLPIRVVLEAFGANVGWDRKERIVIVRSAGNNGVGTDEPMASDTVEMKAMWISYLEFMEMPKEENAFYAAFDKMCDNSVDYGMNAVIVQVRPDSDAMYPSDYFPWSKFASGKQGLDPGYDPLEYMIEAAHKRNLEFHAWINPYRITGYQMGWSEVSSDHPAKTWLTDHTTVNDRWVLQHDGAYYYNPAINQVRALVVDGVREIVENYEVDGIHFDDYFYPGLNDNDQARWFDKPEYMLSSATTDIVAWRRNNVSRLVQEVYQAVKKTDPTVVFGISPAGNVDNLRSNSNYFVDIDRWMSTDGYIDYIMPQLYWGFERKTSAGTLAPYAYENNLNTWIGLKRQGNVKLYIGLNVANAGSNVFDNNTISEWLRYSDILKRQVEMGRNSGEVSGFAFFRHNVFETTAAKAEVENLMKVLK